jgi:hypothetical protein
MASGQRPIGRFQQVSSDYFGLITIPVRSKYSNMLKPWAIGLRASKGLGKTLRANSEPV